MIIFSTAPSLGKEGLPCREKPQKSVVFGEVTCCVVGIAAASRIRSDRQLDVLDWHLFADLLCCVLTSQQSHAHMPGGY